MNNYKNISVAICMNCKYNDVCNRAIHCIGQCSECDYTACENNPYYAGVDPDAEVDFEPTKEMLEFEEKYLR